LHSTPVGRLRSASTGRNRLPTTMAQDLLAFFHSLPTLAPQPMPPSREDKFMTWRALFAVATAAALPRHLAPVAAPLHPPQSGTPAMAWPSPPRTSRMLLMGR